MELVTLRRSMAFLLLFTFVVSTTIGFFILVTWAGFVSLGITSGIAAYLLGSEAEETA